MSQTEGLKIAATSSFFTSVCSTTTFRLVFSSSSSSSSAALAASLSAILPSLLSSHRALSPSSLSSVSTVPRLCRCLLRLPGFSRALLIAAVRDAEEVFFPPRPPTAEVTAATTLPCNHSSTAALRWVSARRGHRRCLMDKEALRGSYRFQKALFFAHREKLESIRTRPSDQQHV